VDDIVGLNPDGTQRDHHDGYQHDFAVQLVERGFVVLALEMLGFGHRRDDAARRSGPSQTSCQPAAGAALLLGETMAGWRVWDATCAIDLLESRPDVNSERLAIAGISGGGTVGLYAAALDKRIKVAILSCSFCTFRDSIFSISHCIDNYVPGMLRWFEMADVAAMIAPRGLFCENGNRDEIFPEGAARRAADQTRQAFVVLGASDRFKLEINEGDHQFYGKGAFERLGPWLETTPLSY
jgi:dienelactone hydrolase